MKKFLKNWWYSILLGIAIIFLLTLLSGCSVMKTITVYQKYYPGVKESEAVTDLYSQVRENQVDSIPLNKWLTLQAKNDDGYLLQKSISSVHNDKTSYKFIYTKHVVLDSSFYSIKVYLSTKDRKLQKFYGR
jgi:hypothetical protein